MFDENWKDVPLVRELAGWDGGAVASGEVDRGELALDVAPEKILAVCHHLKEKHQFIRLSTITAVDWPGREARFEVVYHVHSIDANQRLRLKCGLPAESPEIDSVTPVWGAANWYEREVFDLFGIVFRGHPDLRRIMMPEDWEGHPLRKDYPIHGYKYSYQDEQAPL
jgi:NADH-quinone oxidoreductase subunit C